MPLTTLSGVTVHPNIRPEDMPEMTTGDFITINNNTYRYSESSLYDTSGPESLQEDRGEPTNLYKPGDTFIVRAFNYGPGFEKVDEAVDKGKDFTYYRVDIVEIVKPGKRNEKMGKSRWDEMYMQAFPPMSVRSIPAGSGLIGPEITN